MRVEDEAGLAEAIAGAEGPVRVIGGGTRDIGRPVAGARLEVGLTGVELYEPGALTLVARAGTPLAEIEALLAGEGQRLAFEPMDHRALLGTAGVPTIGGVVAANVSGPRRVQAGAARDFTLGARFVDGAGRIIRNGGRVMKNVTGYDLVKLMAGSWGTLGVLTEVSLKVLPVPETEATLVFPGLDAARAGEAMRAALACPWEVTGAAWDGETCLRIEGFEASVAYRVGRLRAALARFGVPGLLEGDASRARWAGLRDASAMAAAPVVLRASLRPGAMARVREAAQAQGAAAAQADWGGGLLWIGAEESAAGALLQGLRAAVAAAGGGHVTLVKAPVALRAALPVFQPEPPALARLSQAIRAQFDPRAILNPGLMG